VTTTALFLFAATELALSLTPGPAVLLVVSQGMRSGARASLFGASGVIVGDLFYFAISALGLGAILLASQALFTVIKSAGAVYLVYLGLRMILTAPTTMSGGSDAGSVVPHHRLFRQGLLMQLANPKAILFFAALVPQFINPQLAPAPQFFILGIVSVSIQFPTLVLYGWLAAKGGQWFRRSGYAAWLDRVAGAFLIGAGVKLALSRSTTAAQ
jgi:homoserine/homoserine lactone efflux protein